VQGVVPIVTVVANEIETAAGVAPDVQTQVQTAIQGVGSAAGALATAESNSDALPLGERIVADANSVLGVAATLALPPRVAMIARIAQASLPALTMLVSILHLEPQPQPQPAAEA
jgi:hypothetical protein